MINSREQFLIDLTVNNPEEHGRNYNGYINRMNQMREEYLNPTE